MALRAARGAAEAYGHLWTVEETAHYFGINLCTLWGMIRAGQIPHVVLAGPVDAKPEEMVRFEPGVVRDWAAAGGGKVVGGNVAFPRIMDSLSAFESAREPNRSDRGLRDREVRGSLRTKVKDDGRHEQVKVYLSGFPKGRVGRVTLVTRNDRFYLRWYQAGRNRWEPVESPKGSDALALAIARAGEINKLLADAPRRRLSWQQLTLREAVKQYLKSKEAGNATAATARKYAGQLARAVAFAEGTDQGRRCRFIDAIDSAFCESFVSWLDAQATTANGGPDSASNPARPLGASERYETRARLRGILEYAIRNSPPLVPPAWRNPMTQELVGRRPARGAQGLSAPPVGVDDLVRIVAVVDTYGLALLAPLFSFGPRPSELGRILLADFDPAERFLQVICRPEAGYTSKGRRNKFWPVSEALLRCIQPLLGRSRGGPIFIKRSIFEGKATLLPGADGKVLAAELARRKQELTGRLNRPPTKAEIEELAESCWRDAGAAEARDVQRELERAAQRAGLAVVPTPRDVRHLVETLAEEARLAPGVIRHLLGHSPTRGDALHHYNHVSRQALREQVGFIDQRRQALVEALARRARELERPEGNGVPAAPAPPGAGSP